MLDQTEPARPASNAARALSRVSLQVRRIIGVVLPLSLASALVPACGSLGAGSNDSETGIHGRVAPGWERVRIAFESNFRERNEIGAACAVFVDGRLVVDLWAGRRDAAAERPWRRDTMACVFSTSKAMAAAATTVALSRGLFELDEPVARYWPEFAQQDKGNITVRQLLAHQAGLSAIDTKITPERISDREQWARVLARQRPRWTPGTRHGYHGLTLGFYQSELIRRTDPQGRSIGQFFAEELADPVEAEFYFGLPDSVDDARIAEMTPFGVIDMLTRPDLVEPRMLLGMVVPGSLVRRSLMNIDMSGPGDIADRRWTRTEFPSATGVGTARGIARIMGALATRDAALPLSDAVRAELYAPPSAPSGGEEDLVLQAPTAYALGFTKPCATFDPGFSESSFMAFGAGGSMAIGDPELALGFAYVMNKMSMHLGDDPRAMALAEAVRACADAAARHGGQTTTRTVRPRRRASELGSEVRRRPAGALQPPRRRPRRAWPGAAPGRRAPWPGSRRTGPGSP